jgi:hypothetical protein
VTITSTQVSPPLDRPEVDRRPGSSDLTWAERAYHHQRREPSNERRRVLRASRSDPRRSACDFSRGGWTHFDSPSNETVCTACRNVATSVTPCGGAASAMGRQHGVDEVVAHDFLHANVGGSIEQPAVPVPDVRDQPTTDCGSQPLCHGIGRIWIIGIADDEGGLTSNRYEVGDGPARATPSGTSDEVVGNGFRATEGKARRQRSSQRRG